MLSKIINESKIKWELSSFLGLEYLLRNVRVYYLKREYTDA
ncbi:hypothetical protein HMPREF0971_03341 [Segatella oris F0302]|uniref:Uncharacterized protein n=1 Tax=Segatella oris F0302 TaxID=649760 RepID=D1QWE4_9BACT|nr:hypothetical protein HMPREF0971_03341 [Segatella oris F0302]